METVFLALHVLLAIVIIALVLLQQGKGAEAGASFGGGASQTVFGSSGHGSFLAKVTAFMAAGLFATSFVLAIYASNKAQEIGSEGVPNVVPPAEVQLEEQLPGDDTPVVVPSDTDIPTTE